MGIGQQFPSLFADTRTDLGDKPTIALLDASTLEEQLTSYSAHVGARNCGRKSPAGQTQTHTMIVSLQNIYNQNHRLLLFILRICCGKHQAAYPVSKESKKWQVLPFASKRVINVQSQNN